MRDTLYPEPNSRNSRPDTVVPSQLKEAEIVVGVEGPAATSNFALNDPTPLASEC